MGPDQRSAAAQAYRGWYQTPQWRAISKAQLATDPLCAMCLQQRQVRPATICDHITPHKGDHNLFWNGPFQSLCKRCHDSTKQGDERRGYSGLVDADGWPTDPKHPANRGGEGVGKRPSPSLSSPAPKFSFNQTKDLKPC